MDPNLGAFELARIMLGAFELAWIMDSNLDAHEVNNLFLERRHSWPEVQQAGPDTLT